MTKQHNKRMIMIYYAIALVFVSFGLYLKNETWYVVAVVFLGVAMFRKYWLHKRLKE